MASGKGRSMEDIAKELGIQGLGAIAMFSDGREINYTGSTRFMGKELDKSRDVRDDIVR